MTENGRRLLGVGELAPMFRAESLGGNRAYSFHMAAGRPVLLLLFGSAARSVTQSALRLVADCADLFDDVHASFFGVTVDPSDADRGRIAQRLPGIRFFLDYDRQVSHALGACSEQDSANFRPHWLVLDRMLRVSALFPLAEGEAAIAALRKLALEPVEPDWAPVLMVPRVLEPELCHRLIDLYDRTGGEESGFMQEVDGKTVLKLDPQHKQRRDVQVDDAGLRAVLRDRMHRRLVPMIHRAFQFQATRMERFLIGCYEAGAGHFRPHRDNTTKGTAHRRFAVTINLNAEDYEGGNLRFPEFGPREYRAPTGGAVVFSCSLLHEARPVTKGRRYTFLPFLYDEAAALVREENNAFLGEGVTHYPGPRDDGQAGEAAAAG